MGDTILEDCKCCGVESDTINHLCEPCSDHIHAILNKSRTHEVLKQLLNECREAFLFLRSIRLYHGDMEQVNLVETRLENAIKQAEGAE